MNRVLALIFAVALAIPTLNAADEVDAEELQNYIQALEQRLEQLEAQTGVIQERQIQIEEETMTYLESLGALKELTRTPRGSTCSKTRRIVPSFPPASMACSTTSNR